MSKRLCGAEVLADAKPQHYPNLKLSHVGLLTENRATLRSERCLDVVQGVAQKDKEEDEKSESLRNIFPGYVGFGGRNKTQRFWKEGIQVLLAYRTCSLHINNDRKFNSISSYIMKKVQPLGEKPHGTVVRIRKELEGWISRILFSVQGDIYTNHIRL